MTKPTVDVFRVEAERMLGRPISDEDWEQSRPAWKRALYGAAWGVGARQLKKMDEERRSP